MSTSNPQGMAGNQFTAPAKKKRPLLWIILGLILLGLPLACCGGCIYLVYGLATAPVDAAVQSLKDDVEIAGKLGTPITKDAGFSISNLTNNNGNGSAELEFNARGPAGAAHVAGRMKLIAGIWSPDGLVVTFDDGTTKNLK